MGLLNKNASSLMLKYKSRGATDITGFGLQGHSTNLVKAQKAEVDFHIHTLPIIDHMAHVNDNVFNFRLKEGYSAETSGGLLVMLP
jgi:selenide,water dikinase